MASPVETDGGAFRFGVAADLNRNRVVIEFSQPVGWFEMTPEEALRLVQTLIETDQMLAKARGLEELIATPAARH